MQTSIITAHPLSISLALLSLMEDCVSNLIYYNKFPFDCLFCHDLFVSKEELYFHLERHCEGGSEARYELMLAFPAAPLNPSQPTDQSPDNDFDTGNNIKNDTTQMGTDIQEEVCGLRSIDLNVKSI